MTRREFLILSAAAAAAQEPKPVIAFTCPMDREIRSKGPGKCPRCGMRLAADLPVHREYRLELKTTPAVIRAGTPFDLDLAVRDPDSGAIVRDFEVVHERIFHLFLIGPRLSYFAHEHPERLPSGGFRYRANFPEPGAYRIAADCYPKGATIQFLARTLITSDADLDAIGRTPALTAGAGPQQGANLTVELTTEPAEPVAGKETILFFDLSPANGLEQYLAAWGHMLVASADRIDLIHDHPLYADGGPRVQFNVIFPRERIYRVWVQFQRQGVVNTVAFNVPVKALR